MDIPGKGMNASTVSFSAARIPGGKNLMYKGHAPVVVGDCPTVWTPASMPVETGRCEILVQPEKKKTVYRIDGYSNYPWYCMPDKRNMRLQ